MKKQYVVNNLKIFLGVCIFVLFLKVTTGAMETYFALFVAFSLCGVANGAYWLYIILRRNMEKPIALVIVLFAWAFVFPFGVILLIPTIVYDVVYLIICIIKERKEGISSCIVEDEVKREIRTFCWKRSVYTSLLTIATIAIVITLFSLSIFTVLKITIALLMILIYLLMRFGIAHRLQQKFEVQFVFNCDAKRYYEIYKYLYEKYPYDYGIKVNYAKSLLFYISEDIEIRQFLNKNDNYKKQSFYKLLLVQLAKPEDKLKIFEEICEKQIPLYDKKYAKTGVKIWSILSSLYQMERDIYREHYIEALKICEKEQFEMNTIHEVRKNYFEAICYLKTGEINKAKCLFNKVMQSGNGLRMSKQSIAYLEEIENL